MFILQLIGLIVILHWKQYSILCMITIIKVEAELKYLLPTLVTR